MPTAEVKSVWWACITWPRKSAKLSLSSLLLGGNCYKSDNFWSIWLIMLCLSPYQRVFYALASWCPSRRTRDFSKRRGLIACVQTMTPTAELLGPNHLRSLPAAPHSDLSARQYKGVIPGYDVRTSAYTARYPRIPQKF